MNSQLIQFNRLKNKSGKNVEVVKSDFSKIETICIVKEFDNGNNSTEDKTIFFSIEDKINQGDMIEYENNTYIILLMEENINNVYMRYVARRCDHTIKIYVDNKLVEIPCNISTYSQDIFENQYVKLPTGNIKITCQNNNISNKISYDKRFIKMRNAYKIVGFTSENKGLKYLYCEKTEIDNTMDDLENEIADRWRNEVKHNYSIEVTPTELNINKGNTEQLHLIVKDTTDSGTVVVENPTIIYTSNNNNIVTIDNTGLITAIGEGETTITVKFENIEKIINISVSNVVELVITGKDNMAIGRTRTYTSNIPVIWSVKDIDNATSTPWASITSQTDTSVTVKTTDKWIFDDDGKSKYFILTAIDKNNSSNIVEKKIKITSY